MSKGWPRGGRKLGGTILGLSLLWMIGRPAITHAAPKRLIGGDVHQGQVTQSFWLNQTLVQTLPIGGETRRIYRVDVENVTTAADSDRILSVQRQTYGVQCSTVAPLVAFKSPAVKDVAIVHYLNPGGTFGGYNQGSYGIYWAVCHNLWMAQNRTNVDLATTAKNWGYAPDLKMEQVEIPDALMRSLK